MEGNVPSTAGKRLFCFLLLSVEVLQDLMGAKSNLCTLCSMVDMKYDAFNLVSPKETIR
jgi:hypothetical protein